MTDEEKIKQAEQFSREEERPVDRREPDRLALLAQVEAKPQGWDRGQVLTLIGAMFLTGSYLGTKDPQLQTLMFMAWTAFVTLVNPLKK